MRYEELSAQDLEALKEQITGYYETYYSELRSRMSDHSLGLSGSVPEHFGGNRRVVTELGQDGLIVTHWPAGRDSFDFHISPEKPVRELAAEQCAGEEILDCSPGSDFGVYEIDEPLKLAVEGRVVWTSGWTSMQISSRVDVWQDADQARKAVEEDLRPYTNTG